MTDSFLSNQILANVRYATRMLEKAALSPIPDLEELAPRSPAKWSADQTMDWSVKATKRASEAFAWRDNLMLKIGSVHVPNNHKPDPSIDHETLCRELGYSVTRRVHDKSGRWTGGHEPDPNWGPPETLLGEFEERVPDGETGGFHYVPGSHPVLWLGNSRTFLGPPPEYLSRPPFFEKLLDGMPFTLLPGDWPEYSGIILAQCLLVRARALQLCQWCRDRLEAWDAAFFPMIVIGPDRKSARTRSLKVFAAGARVELKRDRIPCADAKRLLSLVGGCEVDFEHRKYRDTLLKLIPPLLGHLKTVSPATSTPVTGGRYCLPAGLKVIVES